MLERIEKITPEEAAQWREGLMDHISKQHPHLAIRFWERAKKWKSLLKDFPRYPDTRE